MDLNLVLRLEKKVDEILARNSALEGEVRQLQQEKAALLQERQQVCAELDRILEKLERAEQEES